MLSFPSGLVCLRSLTILEGVRYVPSTCVVDGDIEDNITRMRHRFCRHSSVGVLRKRVTSGGCVMAAGKAGLGVAEVRWLIGWCRGPRKTIAAFTRVVFVAIRPFYAMGGIGDAG